MIVLDHIFEVDNEVLKYFENRWCRWSRNLDGTDPDKVNIVLTNPNVEFVPVIFRYRHIHDKPLTTERILEENPDLTYPFILLTPTDPIFLDDRIAYVGNVNILKENGIVEVHGNQRRVEFNYQVEGLSDDWIDHRILTECLTVGITEQFGVQNYIPLFNRTYTVRLDSTTMTPDENSNKYRVVSNVKIEMNLFTAPPVVLQTIEEFLIHTHTGMP